MTMAFRGRFGHGQETLRTNLIVRRFFMAPGSFVDSIWKKDHFLQKAKRLTTVLHLPVFSLFFFHGFSGILGNLGQKNILQTIEQLIQLSYLFL